MAMSGFELTIGGLGTAAKILKTLKDLVATPDAKAQVSELYDVILSSQASAMEAYAHQRSLLEEVANLKQEMADMKAWEETKQRYVWIPPWDGAPFVTYALKESRKGSEAPHWICTKCYDDGRRSILNPDKDKDHWTVLRCPTCKATMPTGYRGYPKAEYAPG